MMVNVLIADDQEMVRAGLRQIMNAEPTIDVVAEASDGQQALVLARSQRPDVCVLDIRMPHVDGLQVAEALSRDESPPAIVIVTTFNLDEYLFRALQAGVAGFVLKDASARIIVESVLAAASGEALISPGLTNKLISRYLGDRQGAAETTVSMTKRETDTLLAVASGMTNNEIAESLYISLSTVKGHLENLMRKTDSRNRVQLVIWAYNNGVASAPPC